MPITDPATHERWRETLRQKALARSSQPRVCTEEGCEKPTIARGLCKSHYNRWKEAHPDEVGVVSKKHLPCTVEGCDRKQLARGYCGLHWQRWATHGDPLVVKINRGSGYTVDAAGYRVVWADGHPNADGYGRILEHRKVMSDVLGRPLLPGESVHHKNGDRQDNRPENLEVWVNYQPVGGRVVDVLAWADEILERYNAIA